MQRYENVRNEQPTKTQLTRWQAQEARVFDAFFEFPKTMFQVEKETHVMRPSICRAVSKWKKAGKIHVIKTDKDPLTGCRAGFLTTNPIYWPRPSVPGQQTDLFQ